MRFKPCPQDQAEAGKDDFKTANVLRRVTLVNSRYQIGQYRPLARIDGRDARDEIVPEAVNVLRREVASILQQRRRRIAACEGTPHHGLQARRTLLPYDLIPVE